MLTDTDAHQRPLLPPPSNPFGFPAKLPSHSVSSSSIASVSLSWTDMQISELQLLETIGSGMSCTVRLCRHPTLGYCALKIVPRHRVQSQVGIRRIKCEKVCLQAVCTHPLALHLFRTANDEDNLYFVTEFVEGGHLRQRLKRAPNGCFSEYTVRFIGAQLVCIISYMHSIRILHRDIKTQNCLIDSNGLLRLIDFGSASMMDDAEKYSFCGTSYLLPPECLNASDSVGRSSVTLDWWSLGALLFELLLGAPPFFDLNGDETKRQIRDVSVAEAVDRCRQRLFEHHQQRHPGTAFSVPDLSPSCLSLLQGLLDKNPATRFQDASDVISHPFFADIDWSVFQSLNTQFSAASASGPADSPRQQARQLLVNALQPPAELLHSACTAGSVIDDDMIGYVELTNYEQRKFAGF